MMKRGSVCTWLTLPTYLPVWMGWVSPQSLLSMVVRVRLTNARIPTSRFAC